MLFPVKGSKLLILIAFVCGCMPTRLFAALSWEEKTLNFKAGLSETEIVGHFKFQNTGTSSVAITAVAVSCDCVSASASVKNLDPGQSAEIVATVSLNNLSGAQSKDI